MINYCCNTGFIQNGGKGPTGGLVGEIGDPREWSAMNIVSCVLGSVECVLGLLGPVIAVTGEALEKATTTAGKVFGELVHVLHMAETGADWLLVITDKVILREGIVEMLTEKETELLQESLDAKVSEIDTSVKTEMESLRGGLSLAAGLLPSGLDAGTLPEIGRASCRERV